MVSLEKSIPVVIVLLPVVFIPVPDVPFKIKLWTVGPDGYVWANASSGTNKIDRASLFT